MPQCSEAVSSCRSSALQDDPLPQWLSPATRAYLDHVCTGKPIRAIAREKGCHPSTVLRQIRKIEAVRDDPLKDEALETITSSIRKDQTCNINDMEPVPMPSAKTRDSRIADENVDKEARRILRRLCESGAYLLVSSELAKAAVFRETVPGRRTRIAVVDREVAQVFALRDWIEGKKNGRVSIYNITNAGRSALKRLISEAREHRGVETGYAESPSPFQEQHREYGERTIIEDGGVQRIRYNLAESPLTSLARKKDKLGKRYLTADQLEAGERLREDFELAQLGPRVSQNWDNFLTASSKGSYAGRGGPGHGPSAARDRVANAMKSLGPGLADIAFRCCCFLEGLEAAEKRLGWSARSGKIVLSIALQRLADHYANQHEARMVG